MPQGCPEGAFIRAPGRVVDSVCNLIVGAAGRVRMAVLARGYVMQATSPSPNGPLFSHTCRQQRCWGARARWSDLGGQRFVLQARTGCQWRLLPREFPHYSTVQRGATRWSGSISSCWCKRARRPAVNRALRRACSTANRSRPPRAAGRVDMMPAKKVEGRKRHIVTDTTGLLVGAEVHPADVAGS
jgi:transposase